jgi:hypothetical protein
MRARLLMVSASLPPSPATCQAFEGGNLSVGPVRTATDPSLNALIPPFRIK